jgi:hypothetical protein
MQICALKGTKLLTFLIPLAAPTQYGEFRHGYAKDKADTRIVSYGLRYFIEQYISKRWTLEDVERADIFYKCVCVCV